jgi:single-strand DNA-binding protein
MNSVNKVTLVGHVGAAPEIRSTQSGIAVAKMSLATNDYWKDRTTGGRKEKTAWHRITAMGKMADICRKYVKKGAKLYIEGSLNYSSYEKDGHTFYSTDIVLKEINFLDSKNEEDENIGIEYLPEDDTLPVSIPL